MDEVLGRLRRIGFYSTADHVASGTLTFDDVMKRLRRSGPVRADNADCIALANDIERALANTREVVHIDG